MERIISKDDFGNIACNNIIIHANNIENLGENIKDFSISNWKVINPKYYIDKSDDMIFEIWYHRTGIIIDKGLNKHLKNGEISKDWGIINFKEITYGEAMSILEQNKDLGYNKKVSMSREIINDKSIIDAIASRYYRAKEPIGWEKLTYQLDIKDMIEESKGNACCEIEAPTTKQKNNGGASDWYSLPKDANTLQDLIEHRNMNGSVKDIFKACYRLGIKTEDELRDLNKMAYYSLREVGRITGRKDYIAIARELMGSQANEKDENEI